HDIRTLRQQLPIEARRLTNDVPQSLAERIEVVTFFEDVGHARAEHAPSFSSVGRVTIPLERLCPVMIAEEATRRVLTPDLVPVPLRIAFCVAVIAAGRDLHAAPPGIKCVIGPFDLRRAAHSTNLPTFTPSAFASFSSVESVGSCFPVSSRAR